MLTITNKQIDCFESESLNDFINRILEYLQNNYPMQYNKEDKQVWKEWIILKVKEAEKFNIIKENHVTEYIVLCLCYNELNETPKPKWILDNLNRKERLPGDKIEVLLEGFNFK